MLTYIKQTFFRCRAAIPIAVFTGVVLSPTVSATSPEEIYADNCAFCHSRMVPPFVGPELRGRGLSPIFVKTFVRNGAKGMLTFTEAAITDSELDALGKWIQESAAPPKPPMPPMPGQGGAQ